MSFDFEHYKPHPTEKHLVVHDRFCTYQEFYDALIEYLKTVPLDDEYTVEGILDYLSCHAGWSEMHKQIPKFRWIYCWFTRGGNEGYYFHIESAFFDKTSQLFLAKTLSGDLEIALKINTAICRFICETMDK